MLSLYVRAGLVFVGGDYLQVGLRPGLVVVREARRRMDRDVLYRGALIGYSMKLFAAVFRAKIHRSSYLLNVIERSGAKYVLSSDDYCLHDI